MDFEAILPAILSLFGLASHALTNLLQGDFEAATDRVKDEKVAQRRGSAATTDPVQTAGDFLGRLPFAEL
jgi:hypothetical protein